MHFIWKLRNERVIRERSPANDDEIRNRWTSMINTKLKLDCLLTNSRKFGRKAREKKLIQNTWRGVLAREDEPPEDWTQDTEVLVGIG
jgi:ribonuclease HI